LKISHVTVSMAGDKPKLTVMAAEKTGRRGSRDKIAVVTCNVECDTHSGKTADKIAIKKHDGDLPWYFQIPHLLRQEMQ
jgi:hypothetical protein